VIELVDKSVLVVGLGVSGHAAARVLLDKGARVTVTEAGSSPAIEARASSLRSLGARVETGGHDVDGIEVDLVVASPGIPPTAPVMAALRAARVRIISEVELAYSLARCDFLAVTGTNGKTTTTSLLARILAEAGIDSLAAGNIGAPVVEAVNKVGEGGAIALEVSSFQLADIDRFSPRVAVLLNLAEDHMDWHGGWDAYVAAKARITENQSSDDFFVANADDAAVMGVADSSPARVVCFSTLRAVEDGIGVGGRGEIVYRGSPLLSAGDISLSGRGGLEDALAASVAALEYGVDPGAVARALKSFDPLAHRLQDIARFRGITFIDDSKATNPHAVLAAVQGMHDVVLIAGGRSKGIDLSPLRDAVPAVSAVVTLGEAADDLQAIFESVVPVSRAGSMSDAVQRAVELALPGGSVLLSPGCASLDMYSSYVERGEDFRRAVEGVRLEASAREGVDALERQGGRSGKP
jgi:UDP-N-acetylmuramoylalanine--D-glutamate ligase